MVLSLPFGCVEGIRSCENGAFPSGVPLNQGETGVQSKSGGGPRLKKIISIPGSLLGFEHVGLSLVRFGRFWWVWDRNWSQPQLGLGGRLVLDGDFSWRALVVSAQNTTRANPKGPEASLDAWTSRERIRLIWVIQMHLK